MATSKRCTVCNKELGPMHCTGCDEYFCLKDFKTHREGMFSEMDKIVEERNRLQDAINNGVQHNEQQSPLIEQIDKWQNSTIQKVKQVAAQARQQMIELLNSKRTKTTTEFKNFSQELANLKESENYVEYDLARLSQMINQFKQDLRQFSQPTSIELHTEQSDKINWNSFIYVEEKQIMTNIRRRQQQAARQSQVPAPPPQSQLECLSYLLMRQINEQYLGGRACPTCNDHSLRIPYSATTHRCLVPTGKRHKQIKSWQMSL